MSKYQYIETISKYICYREGEQVSRQAGRQVKSGSIVRAFLRPPVVCDHARPARPLSNLRKLRFPMELAWGEPIIPGNTEMSKHRRPPTLKRAADSPKANALGKGSPFHHLPPAPSRPGAGHRPRQRHAQRPENRESALENREILTRQEKTTTANVSDVFWQG
jgi:hypothetical protein